MQAGDGSRAARVRSWLRGVLVAAAVAGAALAFLVWRPLTVWSGVTRVRLWVAGVRDATVLAGSYRIHYLAAGSGRPVVLLHGNGGAGLQWRDYIPALAEGARIYAPDLLGFGSSEQPDVDYSIPLQTEVLRGWLDANHVTQADLVGVSMGGWVAASFARLHPNRVRRLVLINAAGLKVPEEVNDITPRDASDVPRVMRLLTPRRPPFPALLAPGVVREMRPNSWVVARHLRTRQLGKGILDGQLSPVTMPVLLVWGALDRLTPLAWGREFHRQIAQSQLVVLENCGHLAPFDDCRSYVLPEVRAFLSAAQPEQGGIRTVTVPW